MSRPLPWLSLLRWLGPWAGERLPPDTLRTRSRSTATSTGASPSEVPVDLYEYRPQGVRPRGVWVVTPGMHFLGPDDPRLDRFCRVLARAGFLVVAPLLTDFLALRLAPGAARELSSAVEHAGAQAASLGLGVPSLFSISFGSMPAIEVAARPDAHVARLVLFGGFCDFEATVRHAVMGQGRDPLNSPVVFGNLLDWLDEGELAGIDREGVRRAWRTMVERTWGRMELKAPGARDPIAHVIAQGLGERDRALFLAGCGLGAHAAELLERGLVRARGKLDFVDPRPHLGRMRVPVTVVHGRDDDVIPFTQAQAIADALPAGHAHEVWLTGFYSHTGSAVPSPAAIAGEVRTLLAILGTLSSA